MADLCAICNESTTDRDDIVKPGKVGIDSINRASKARKDRISAVVGDRFHIDCRKDYIHK